MASPSPSLVFTVRRCKPELVAPAKPTPYELKLLSDIDAQVGLRFQIPFTSFYRHDPSMAGKDPVQVIRQALAKTLVFYYPFAGRLREGHGRKLMVDCNGEGVMFIEADADVTLDQFGDALQPPIPCFDELLCNVPGSEGIINSPILLIQITRLRCGGFIFALRLNHTMSDGPGLLQFWIALAEIARGAEEPSVLPVWRRELLSARDPPRVTRTHREYGNVPCTITRANDMVQSSFFFGPAEVAALRRFVPKHLGQCTVFEIITACVWRCRTLALQLGSNEEVSMICAVNVRGRLNPPLPVGYYGNSFVLPAAVTTAGKLYGSPFVGYARALELLKKAKAEVDSEYAHSVADFLAINGRPSHTMVRSYLVSDVTRARFNEVDFGWGKAVYGGPAKGGTTIMPEMTSLYITFKNGKGQEGILVPIILPAEALERFAKELDEMLKNHAQPISGAQILSSM